MALVYKTSEDKDKSPRWLSYIVYFVGLTVHNPKIFDIILYKVENTSK